MSWTDPSLFDPSPGDVLTAAEIQTYMLDNLLALFTPSQGWPTNPIVKAGVLSGTSNGSGDLTVTFGVAFPTAADFAFLGMNVSAGLACRIQSLSASALTVRFFTSAGAASVGVQSVNWLAVGH